MRTYLAALVIVMIASPALACNGGGNCENAPGHNKEVEHSSPKAAPGPIAGAGLPILAVDYGVYWLVKRRRKYERTD